MNTLPAARPFSAHFWGWDEETTAIRRQTIQNVCRPAWKASTMEDGDSAQIIYETIREGHPGLPFECLLACVFRAGMIMGIRRERGRKR